MGDMGSWTSPYVLSPGGEGVGGGGCIAHSLGQDVDGAIPCLNSPRSSNVLSVSFEKKLSTAFGHSSLC